MRTANNARFLAYLEGTPQARELEEKAGEWSTAWLSKPAIAPVFQRLLSAAGGNVNGPTRNRAAWEAAVHSLREQFRPEQLGFSRTALFRIAPRNLLATDADYRFAFDRRKAELLRFWQQRTELEAFWHEPMEIEGHTYIHSAFQRAPGISDEDFCQLCQHVQLWITQENASRPPELRMSKTDVVGLRSSEDYGEDSADGPRIATIYNGLSGRGSIRRLLAKATPKAVAGSTMSRSIASGRQLRSIGFHPARSHAGKDTSSSSKRRHVVAPRESCAGNAVTKSRASSTRAVRGSLPSFRHFPSEHLWRLRIPTCSASS
jgi:hypothetical protein